MNQNADSTEDVAASAADAADPAADPAPSITAPIDPFDDARRFRFIADRPAALDSEDVFGHSDYATAIASSLMDAPPPFTLGLFGAWGVGKTSIINAVGDAVRRANGAFVSFDVWRYEGDTLRRQFLKDIASQLKASKSVARSYKPSDELRDLDVDVAVPEEHLKISGRNLLVSLIAALFTFGIAFAFFHFQVQSQTGVKTSRSEITADAFLSLILGAVAFIFTMVSRVIRVDQRIISQRRIEEPERFVEKFTQLLEAVKRPRLVIALDNLDRCSPELADEMLATIKTYLEPTVVEGEQCDVVFLIAVDDAALRRHLVARELETRSSTSMDQESAREAAENYVDEYLRKFFMGTLRVKTLLDEEMRTYTERQLQPLIDAYGLSGNDRVTPLVASALRHNPRRVKQFANSLETRLRLIRAREASELIAERDSTRVSSHIAEIAKLAIIEEVFPDRYKELEDDPRLLVNWQNMVIAGEELDGKDPDFAAFLRTTRDVAIDDIYPLLRLRQTEAERELPDFTRFKEAIVLGALPEAAEIVQRADTDKRPRYAVRLVDLLQEELSRGSREGAFNVLDAAFGGAALDLPEGTRRTMAETAVQIPGLRDQLWRLDAASVLAVRPLLSQGDRDYLTESFLRLDLVADGAPDRVKPTAEALAGLLDELSSRELDTLRQALAADSLARRFDDYVALARVRPDLLSDRHVRDAYEQLIAQGPSTQMTGPHAEIMALGLSVGLDSEVGDTFVRQLTTILVSATSVADSLMTTIEQVGDIVEQIPTVSDEVVRQALTEIQAQFPTLISASDGARAPLMHLAGLLADRATERSGETNNAVDWFIDRLFEERPHDALDYFEKSTQPVPEPLRRRSTEQLAQLATSNLHDLRARASSQLLTITNDGPTHFQEVIANLIRSNDFQGAATLVRQWHEELPAPSDLAALYVAQMKALGPTERAPAAEELPSIAAILDSAQSMHAWDALGEMVESTHSAPIASAIRAAQQLGVSDEARYRDLVRRGARHLSSKDYHSEELELIRWVCESGEHLDAAERGALVAQLIRWIRENVDASSQIAIAAAPFAGLTRDQRAEFVDVIIEAEARHPDVASRLSLLVAAETAKLKSRRGAEALKARLSTLRASSTPADQEVARQFDSREAP